MNKKIVAFLSSVFLAVSCVMFSFTAYAADEESAASNLTLIKNDVLETFDTFVPDEGKTIDDLFFPTGYIFINDFTASGTWKDNISWNFDHGTLTLSGSGDIESIIYNYGSEHISPEYYGPNLESYPWSYLYRVTKKIIVEDGITDIPAYCFSNFLALEEVRLGNDVEFIRKFAFSQEDAEPPAFNLYLGENTAFWGPDGFYGDALLIFGYKYYIPTSSYNIIDVQDMSRKPTIYGYTNSKAYYFAKNNENKVNFVSIGEIEYDPHNDPLLPENAFSLEYSLNIEEKALYVNWEYDTQLEDSVYTKYYEFYPENLSDFQEYYGGAYTDYVESLYVQDGITRIKNISNLKSLKVIVIPDSVENISKLPDDVSKLTIVGNEGSYAETFANENEISFVELGEYNKLTGNADLSEDISSEPTTVETDEPTAAAATTAVKTAVTTSSKAVKTTAAAIAETKIVCGDINSDGIIDSKDASAVLVKYADIILKSDKSFNSVYDYNKDGKIDAKDATAILIKAAKDILHS